MSALIKWARPKKLTLNQTLETVKDILNMEMDDILGLFYIAIQTGCKKDNKIFALSYEDFVNELDDIDFGLLTKSIADTMTTDLAKEPASADHEDTIKKI
jgi:hypothetical protein